MVTYILSADLPLHPHLNPGGGAIGLNSTFLEHGHVAQQITGNGA